MDNNTPKNEVEVIEHSTDTDQKVHRIDNHIFIQEGMFCRSLNTFDEFCLDGDVLLITDLNYADNQLHSVEVLAHPRYNALRRKTMLLHDFDENFKVIAKVEAEKIREAEVDAIHLRYKNHEKYVTNLQTDDQERRKLAMEIYSRRIESKPITESIPTQPMPTNALEIMQGGNAKNTIQNLSESLKFHTDILKIETNILAKETQKLKNILNEIIPYTEQRMLGAQVSTNELNQQANRLAQGIASLKLYSGETVAIETICSGHSAPSHVPISMIQQRLYADLELAVFNEEGGENLDAYTQEVFFEELKTNSEFVKQIFPTERSMVLVQLTKYEKEYGCPIENYYVNQDNQRVFILVRDGENIHRVISPIGTHQVEDRLFPSRTDLDDLFKRGQVDITVDDLWYSTAFSLREREILNYKRFLLLIAGLDHNHKLFGDFYPQGQEMQIFFPAFQDKYFNFIHDDDGEGLIGSGFNYSLGDWICQHNSKAVVGSMVLIDVDRIMSEYSAPTCYKYQNYKDGHVRIAQPTTRFQYARIQEDDKGLYIRAEVIKKSEWGQTKGKPYNTRIAVNGCFESTAMLLLNNVKPDHILQFINNRKYRRHILSFIGIFREALKVLQVQFKLIEPLFNTIYESVSVLPNLIPMTKDELEMHIIDSINMWQTKTRKSYSDLTGSMQKKALTQICDSIYYRVTTLRDEMVKQAESLIDDECTPLQFTVAFDGKMYLYTTMPLDQQDNRYSPHAHVNRHSFKLNKTGALVYEQTSQVLFASFKNYEHVLYEYDQNLTKAWLKVSDPYIARNRSSYHTPPLFGDFETKKWVLGNIDKGYKLFTDFVSNIAPNSEDFEVIKDNFESLFDLSEDGLITLPLALIERDLIVAVMQNSIDVYNAILKGEPLNTEFEIRKLSFHEYITWELDFVLPPSATSKPSITATQQARRIFGPAIHAICSKGRKEDRYSPIEWNDLYDPQDVFKFDKLISNPYYNDTLYLQDILFGSGYDSRFENGELLESNKHSLYLLIGPKVDTNIFKAIGNAIGQDLPNSYTYSHYQNLIAPMDIEPSIMMFIKSHSDSRKSYQQELDKAVQKAFISSINQVYEREIPINMEEYKDYKLYCLLNQK